MNKIQFNLHPERHIISFIFFKFFITNYFKIPKYTFLTAPAISLISIKHC